jgi:hypothetical protein
MLDQELNGNKSKQVIGENQPHNVNNRLSAAIQGTFNSTYGPTPTHSQSLEIARNQLAGISSKLEEIRQNKIPDLEKALMEIGAPWFEGQPLPGE